MNFDVGDSRKLGTLNDIYKKRTKTNVVLPSRKMNLEELANKFVSDRRLLSVLPHYMGYGLVVCNPLLWSRFTAAGANTSECRNAFDAYESLKQNMRSRLEFDDEAAHFKKRWDPKLKRMIAPPPECLLDESPHKDEYFVVPKYLALTVFGPESVDCFLPIWLNRRLVCQMLREDEDRASLQQLFMHLCTASRPPPHTPIRKQLEAVINKQVPLTNPIVLNLNLRSMPLDQGAIVAFVIYQMRAGARCFAGTESTSLQMSNAKTMLHFSGKIILPCGIGKTKISATIWHGLYDPIFDQLPHNDFGVMEHAKSANETQRTATSISAATRQAGEGIERFFAPSKSIRTLPVASSTTTAAKGSNFAPPSKSKHVYQEWLESNPNFRNRKDSGPMQTGKLLWVADHDDLLDQAATALMECMPNARVALLKQKSRPDPAYCDIVIASIKTIACQDFAPGYFENFTLVIYDEAHRNMAKQFRIAIAKLSGIPLALFLTATPRHDLLRVIGGPIFVSSTRPFVKQHHIMILHGGVDPSTRPLRTKQRYAKSPQQYGTGGVNGTLDIMAMNQDIAINHARNRMVIDTVYSICTGACADAPPEGYNVVKITKSPPPSDDSPYWRAFHNAVYNNVNFLKASHLDGASTDFAWQQVHSIDAHYCETKSHRVPVIYSTLVPHIILLQHMYAQKWLDEAKRKPEYANANLQIVRTGMRQLAVVNMDRLSHDQLRRFKWIGSGGNGPEFSCASTPLAHNTDATKTFDTPFWQEWFHHYPLAKRFSIEVGRSFPFKLDSEQDKNANKEGKKKSAKNTVPAKEKPETKKYSSTHWMYKSQFYWTPVYYPLPGAVNVDDDLANAPKKTRKKRKACDMEGDGETTPKEPSANCKLFKLKKLNDTRPALDRASGQILATFGLYIGIESYPCPSSLLSDVKLAAKTPHNLEALRSDYVFANYAIASTGIDREDIDTTVMVMPWKDIEQLHGRALRILDTKQEVLHVEFSEPMASYTTQNLKHIQGTEKQDFATQLLIIGKI